jgi:hypothetical protein
LCVIRILVHGTKNSHVNSQYGEQKKNEERWNSTEASNKAAIRAKEVQESRVIRK